MCSPKKRQQNKTLHLKNQIKETQAQQLENLLNYSDDYRNPVVMPFNTTEYEYQLPSGKGGDNYKVLFVLSLLLFIYLFFVF